MTNKKKYRLQIEFSEDAYMELKDLSRFVDKQSISEVLRCAIGCLRFIVNKLRDGNIILTENKEKKEHRKILFDFLKIDATTTDTPKT